MSRTNEEIEKKKRELEQLGYEVRMRVEFVRRTFLVEKQTLQSFLKTAASKHMKLKDAATEALKEWAQKRNRG